jgi:type VI secretion system protein ImpH
MRTTADRLAEREAFLRALEDEPYAHDFYQTVRRIECLHADKPRIGQAVRPADEPLRFGQSVSMAFAPASIAALQRGDGTRAPRLVQHFFGLLGPNGPLPLHLTDYTRERLTHGDATLARFLDVFHHRMLALFYRAWAQARPTASLDRPGDDRYADFVGSLIGIGRPGLRRRDAAGDRVKLFHAGLLARQVRNADGLQALLAGFFRLPVRIEQFVGHWMHLPESDRTRLGRSGPGARLGIGTVAGARVWDRQHKFRIHLGPLRLPQYEGFLPGGSALARLLALVRQYLCLELAWDARLVLAHDETPRLRLGRFGRLGWTAWLGRPRAGRDPDDLLLDAEAVAARHGRRREKRPSDENITGQA